jgi:hypothetical protein
LKKKNILIKLKKISEEALAKMTLEKNEIDFLFYFGIGRGFIERGNSYLVAQD